MFCRKWLISSDDNKRKGQTRIVSLHLQYSHIQHNMYEFICPQKWWDNSLKKAISAFFFLSSNSMDWFRLLFFLCDLKCEYVLDLTRWVINYSRALVTLSDGRDDGIRRWQQLETTTTKISKGDSKKPFTLPAAAAKELPFRRTHCEIASLIMSDDSNWTECKLLFFCLFGVWDWVWHFFCNFCRESP